MSFSPQAEQMLDLCQNRGWFSVETGERARSLCEHGLSVEQALLGTGLVDRPRYEEALSEIHDLPVASLDDVLTARHLSESLTADWQSVGAVPIRQTSHSVTIGFVDPSDAEAFGSARTLALSHGFEMEPTVLLLSDWQRIFPSADEPSSISRLARMIFDIAEINGVHDVHLLADQDFVGVHFHHHLIDEPSLTFDRALFAALVAYFSRVAEQNGWEVEPALTGTQSLFHLVRTDAHENAPHTTEWSDTLQNFFDADNGLLLLIDADPFLRKTIEREAEELPTNDDRVALDQLYWTELSTDDESEAVEHLALAGAHLVVFLSDEPDWTESVSESGVPVSLIRAHQVDGQTAWEVVSG